jgi:cytochrome c biogenesis protein CcmG/thiol:disulfide interchange protein DsbE
MTPTNELPLDEISGVEERPQNRRQWSGALRSLVLPLLLVATIVGALYYVEQRRGDSNRAADATGIVTLPAEKNATGRSPSTEIGRAAPDFLLATPDGGRLRLSDLQGRPLLVNFWASWCTPCRQEMPEIVRAYDAKSSSGFVVVGVDLQENTAQVRAFAQEFGMTFPLVIDRNGGVGDAWHIGGPVQGIPSSYFIDESGVVRARVYGPLTAQTLAENLAKIGVTE